jgi:hypothetical protein
MKKFTVRVIQDVKVIIDETKFDPQFLEEFRKSFYHFKTTEQHLEHLGQMFARGLVDDYSFIEGYGPARDMGISFQEDRYMTVEVLDPDPFEGD